MPQKLGQHFLIKESILERIATAACLAREDLVIEIGPGRGALTEKLLRRAGRVVAIEIDSSLVDYLKQKFAGEQRLDLLESDVLAADLSVWGSVPVAGNLPYYITSPIIQRVLRLRPPRAVFLVQKEVAERLAAKPGSRDYGYLTVQTQLFADVRLLFEVKPGAFRPPPKVDSAVVLLTPKQSAPAVTDQEGLLRFVSACFQQKRKTLRNNLAPVYGGEVAGSWPEAGLRAEQLTIEQFVEMYRRVEKP